MRLDGLRSQTSSKKAVVTFKSMLDVDVLVTWVDKKGTEQSSGVVTAKSKTRMNSFLGHAFRFYSAIDVDTLVLEHVVKQAEEIVPLHGCTDQRAIDLAQENFEKLVHDQKASCLPANQSSAWSCVRYVTHAEFESRTPEHFGFANQEEAGQRHIGDMTDNTYVSHIPDIPRLTKGPGYLKMSFTKRLWDVVLPFYEEKKKSSIQPHSEIRGGYTNNHLNQFDKIELDNFRDTHAVIVSEMQKVLQWWVGAKLKHTSTFGVRIYRRHAMLINHVDRMDTHLASAVLQVAQQTDEGWPLEVVRENGERYEVYLQPGEMVLYEGAKIRHGRPMRFRGTEFGNIFSHFAPIHWHGPQKSPLFKPEVFQTDSSKMEL